MAFLFDDDFIYPTKPMLVQSVVDLVRLSACGQQLRFALSVFLSEGHPLKWLGVYIIVGSISLQMFEVMCSIAVCCMLDLGRVNPRRRSIILADIGVASVVMIMSLFIVKYALKSV